MSNPWDNDPIVKPATSEASDAPWANDPIVAPAEKAAPKELSSTQKAVGGAIASPIIAYQAAKQGVKSMVAPLAALGGWISGNKNNPVEDKFIQNQRADQARLDAVQQALTNQGINTAGAQTVGNAVPVIAASMLAPELQGPRLATQTMDALGIGTKAALVDGVETQVPNMAGKAILAASASPELAAQGYLAGKVAPTSSATTPNETPEEATQNQAVQSDTNAKLGAEIGAGVPIIGAWLVSIIKSPAGRAVTDFGKSLAGSSEEATGRATRNAAEAVNLNNVNTGKVSQTPAQIAEDIRSGIADTNAVNTEYNTNIQPTTAQTMGDIGMSNFEKSSKKNIDEGLKSLNRGSAENKVPDLGAQKSNAAMETAALLKQSNKPLTEAEQQALPNAAGTLANKPTQYLESQAGIDVPENTLSNIKGKQGGDVFGQIDKNLQDVNAKYDEIPDHLTPAANTHDELAYGLDQLDEYKVLTPAEKKMLSDFTENDVTLSSKKLVELNKNLAPIVNRLSNKDPAYAAPAEILKRIKDATQKDLLQSPVPEIASKAKEASDFYKASQDVLYSQAGKDTGTIQSQTKAAFGSKSTLPNETIGANVMSNPESIKDYIRGAKFTGGPEGEQEAKASIKEYLINDLRTHLASNPTNETFQKWAANNSTKIVAGELEPEILGYKDAIIASEKNIATASKLLNGDAGKLVKEAYSDPVKMQHLLDTVTKGGGGEDAIKGLQQLAQRQIEEASINTGVQRSALEPNGRSVAKVSDLSHAIATDPATQEAHKLLWGDKASNIEEASKLLRKWDLDRTNPTMVANDVGAGEELISAGAAQASQLRTKAVSSLDKAIHILHNREYDKVVARLVSDPDYAATIMEGYKARNPFDVEKALNALRNPAIVLNSEKDTNARKTNMDSISTTPVPDAVKYQKKK